MGGRGAADGSAGGDDRRARRGRGRGQGPGAAVARRRWSGARDPVARDPVEPRRRRQERRRAPQRARREHARRQGVAHRGDQRAARGGWPRVPRWRGSPTCSTRSPRPASSRSRGSATRTSARTSFPGAGARAFLVGGPESTITASGTTVELTQALVATKALTAVGEIDPDDVTNRGTWLAPIRNDDQLKTPGLHDRRRRPRAGSRCEPRWRSRCWPVVSWVRTGSARAPQSTVPAIPAAR